MRANGHRLCWIRGPEGIVVGLAQAAGLTAPSAAAPPPPPPDPQAAQREADNDVTVASPGADRCVAVTLS